MGKRLIAALFAVLLAPPLLAQTASDFQKNYAHHDVYELRPGVQMAARFAASGLVCEIRLEPTYFGKDKVDLRFGISDVESLLDKVIPPSQRGKADKKQPSMEIGLGQISEEIRSYSNVRIHILSSHDTTVAYVVWLNRKCE